MIPPIATATADRSDPVRLVRLAALAASHGLLRLTERYLAAFAVALDYGPIVVGALVTLGFGAATVVAERASDASNTADASTAGDGPFDRSAASFESGSDSESALAVLAALSAAAGLLAWAGAPTLDALLGTPLTALGWLVVGIVLLQPWSVLGPTRRFWPTDTRVPPAASADGSGADRRPAVVLGALGVAVAAVIATAAVASVDTVRGGVALLAAIGAAIALVAAVALGTADGEPALEERGGERSADADADTERAPASVSDTSLADDRPLADLRTAVSRLPDRDRWAVVGDGLVRVATVGIVPFLVLLVVEYEAVALSIGGLSLAPAAVFGLLVLAEALGAVVGAVASPALADRIDPRVSLGIGLAVVSLVPIGLVAAPGGAAVAAALFALFGCRTAVEPLRPTVDSSVQRAPIVGSSLPADVRTAVRVAVVPAPLLGGVLYAVDPLVAFTGATTVGLLGVRELGRAFAFGARADERGDT